MLVLILICFILVVFSVLFFIFWGIDALDKDVSEQEKRNNDY
jgi:hypothetical protein